MQHIPADEIRKRAKENPKNLGMVLRIHCQPLCTQRMLLPQHVLLLGVHCRSICC